LTIIIIFIFSLFFIFLAVFKPVEFRELSQEDNIIEWGSVILLFGSSIVFIMTWIKKGVSIYIFKNFNWICLFISFVFFVVAMEEISWFQRIIKVETPEMFKANLQNEMNFHNFNTNYSENIYFFGSFMFLVILPYLVFLFPNILTNKQLKFYVPRPFIGVLGTIPCAFNFDRWDALITQFTLFSCIIILWSFRTYLLDQKERNKITIFLIFLILIQIVFLGNRENYLGLYDLKEYKEFLIPFCFFIYSLDKFNLMKKNEFK